MAEVERNAGGWPIGPFSVTDRDGVIHEAVTWYDDALEEVVTRCKRHLKTTIDDAVLNTTCFLCLTFPLWEDGDA